MNSTLKYSIFSLDSYNRSYNESLILSSNIIGNARIITDSSILQQNGARIDDDYGFYAVAYKNDATDEIIISYRGTDGLIGGEGFGSDLWNGYGVGVNLGFCRSVFM